MPRSYRKPLAHGGHRIVFRDHRGRFDSEGPDVKACECCGAIFSPDVSRLDDHGLIDPRLFNMERDRKRCHQCLALPDEEQERMVRARLGRDEDLFKNP